MIVHFSLSEGFFVLSDAAVLARVRGGVFIPADSRGADSPSPLHGRSHLVVTFPPFSPWRGRVPQGASSIARALAGGKGLQAVRGCLVHAIRVALWIAVALVVAAPPSVGRQPIAYPENPPTRPFDLGRFEGHVPVAEPFVAFAPLRLATFPAVGFFRADPPPDTRLGAWLVGEITWVQVLRRSRKGSDAWEKSPLPKAASCGRSSLYKLEGGSLFRFAGPREKQRVVWAPRDPARACAELSARPEGVP